MTRTRALLLVLVAVQCGKEADPPGPQAAAPRGETSTPREASSTGSDAAPAREPATRLRDVELADPRAAELALIVNGTAELGIYARGPGPISATIEPEGGASESHSLATSGDARTPAILALPGSGARAVLVRVTAPAGTSLERARVKDEEIELPPARSLAGSLRGRSFLVIACDALHAAHLRCYGGERETSPNLDRLASEGVRFEAARSQTSFTPPSVATLLTGLEQERHALRDIGDQLDPGLPTLAEAFKAAGYATAGFVQNLLVNDSVGFARGFDHWREFDSKQRQDLVPELEAYLGTPRSQPCFVYVHFLPPHTPYAPPPEFATRFGTATKEVDGYDGTLALLKKASPRPDDPKVKLLESLYHNHVAYGDHLVGQVAAAVERGDRERTAIFFLSDHGEAFAQHGVLGHTVQVHEEMVRVPMILWAPGSPLRAGSVVREPVWTPDLVPSFGELFGLDVSDDLPGRSFAGLLESDADATPRVLRLSARYQRGVPHQRAIVFGRFKLVAPLERRATALFDLATDPGETKDVAGEHPVVAAALRAELARWVAEGLAPSKQAALPSEPLDPELEAELRALGYAAGER